MARLNDQNAVQRLIEQLQEVYWSYDMERKRLGDISSACHFIFEYSAEEFMGNPNLWREVLVDKDVFYQCVDSILEVPDKPFTIEYLIQTKSGKEKWVRSRMLPIFDENQQLISIDGILTDVTKEKVAEIDLSNYETLLTAVSEANQELLVSTNIAEAIEQALKTVIAKTKCHAITVFSVLKQTQRVRAFMEYDWFSSKENQFIRDLDQEYMMTHIVNEELYNERLSYGESILITKEDFPLYLKTILKEFNIYSIFIVPIMIHERFWGCLSIFSLDGGYKWSDMERQVLATFANSIGHSILRHETLEELIQSRTYFEAILNSGETGIFSVNRLLEVVMYNHKITEMVQHFSSLGVGEEQMIKQTLSHLGHHEMKEYIAAAFNGQIQIVELAFQSNKDEWFECSFSPIFGEVNNVHDVLIGLRNVTKRKQDEASLLDAKREAEQANQAKSDFLSSMSHELRTPLNAILGFSQLLEIDQMEPLTENQQENLQEILKAGHHLLNLVNEVLDLARIESGKATLSIESIEIRKLIYDCVKLVEPLTYKNKVTLTIETLAFNQCFIRADLTRMKQVLVNLLSNAIKYNKPNGQVTVSCFLKEQFIQLSVRDTGIGIKESECEKIFEPFYRNYHREIEGTGIGLAVARQLIHLMSGEIYVESEFGVGSCFTVYLPLCEVEEEYGYVLKQENVMVTDEEFMAALCSIY